jgi:hypothetical protein
VFAGPPHASGVKERAKASARASVDGVTTTCTRTPYRKHSLVFLGAPWAFPITRAGPGRRGAVVKGVPRGPTPASETAEEALELEPDACEIPSAVSDPKARPYIRRG